jgi:hypothetical protein
MDLSAFYGAFSPACFALLGLWLVAVQIRTDWWGNSRPMRRAYGIALLFALPGLMSVLALVDTQTHTFWRISFVIVGLSGALVLALVLGWPVPRSGDQSGQRPFPGLDRLALASYLVAIVLYLAIAALAAAGGQAELRSEAVLQTALVFLGFNAGWLLLVSGQKSQDPAPPKPASPASAASTP